MKAVRKLNAGFGNIAFINIPEESPKDNEVKIKIAYAGICGTDMSIYSGAKSTYTPLTMGHEFSGVITEVGKDVKGWKVGDRVIAETTKEYCGACEFCKTGKHSLCPERGALGQQVDGVFAESVCQVADMLHRVPDGVSLLEAALVEPAACTYHAVYDLNDIKPADKVVVIGPGPIGLLATQMLKAVGAYVIISGVDGDQSRLVLAQELGADRTVMTTTEDLKQVVDEVTGGVGADYVFECAGFESAITMAFDIVKKMGTVVQVGIPNPQGVNLPNYTNVMMKELRVVGSFSHRYVDWDKTLELINRGLLNLKPLVSHFFTLEECEKAFAAKDKIKVVFKIHAELDD